MTVFKFVSHERGQEKKFQHQGTNVPVSDNIEKRLWPITNASRQRLQVAGVGLIRRRVVGGWFTAE